MEHQLNVARDQALYPGLCVMYCCMDTGVITFWYDLAHVIHHWHTTDWDTLGISVVRQKAAQYNLSWE